VDAFSSLSTRSLTIAIAKNESYGVIIECRQVYMATASRVVLEKGTKVTTNVTRAGL